MKKETTDGYTHSQKKSVSVSDSFAVIWKDMWQIYGKF
ncbi:hypothetical protein N624_1870 [Levilactobacillus brevis]|nr:hypothetical protein N624_1870 [Levilactobacillus brevis]